MSPLRLERPAAVDAAAWALTATLPRKQGSRARGGLAALAERDHPTDLDCDVDLHRYSELTDQMRWALRSLWSAARNAGLRSKDIPRRLSRYEIACADGVDPATVVFLRAKARRGSPFGVYGPCIWFWLDQLIEQGLSTDLNVDLENGPVRSLWEELFAKAARGQLEMLREHSRPTPLRTALRVFYTHAIRGGLRQRVIPDVIAVSYDPRGNTARLRALLPAHDRERVERLFDLLDQGSADQQAGRWQRQRRGKDTRAQTTVRNLSSALNSLLAHARDAGSTVSLDAILAPERVADWAKRGHRKDGSPMSEGAPERRRRDLHALLLMAVDLGQPLVDREHIERIRQALDEDYGRRNTEGRPRSPRKEKKFTPTREQILDGIALMEELFGRAEVRFANGRLTRLRFHEECQMRALFHAGLRGMWRNDTAATIDLRQARRDPTGAVIVGGVRAKETGDDHYREIVLLPEMLDYIEPLLAFEGRSIERPLREGEQPQVLRAERIEEHGGRRIVIRRGDHWGHDRLKNEDLEVAGLWRPHPDRPDAMSYSQITHLRRKILKRLGWIGATPHTFRAAGAIYWRMRGWDYEQIMKLGLWRDLKTLLECYAALNEQDQLATLAGLAPSQRLETSKAHDDRRGAALKYAHRAILDVLLKKDPKLADFERVASECGRCFDDVARANAAARGKEWFAPRAPRLTAQEEVAVDEALRPLYPGGMKELLGREIFASDRVAKRKHAAAADDAEPSQRVRPLARRYGTDRDLGHGAGRPT